MKKIFFLVFLQLVVFNTFSQQPFYYYKSERKNLKISKDKILVKFTNDTSYNRRNVFASQNSKLAQISKKSVMNFSDFTVYNVVQGLSETEVNELVKDLRKSSKDEFINNAFESEDGIIQGYTNKFVVRLKITTDLDDFKKLLQDYSVNFIKQDQYSPRRIILEVNIKFGLDALEMANKFYETGLFEYSEPVWKRFMKKMCINDDFWIDQWGLNNIGHIGADIRACDAWEITRGSDDIIVAVIDEGVDLFHPDLRANLIVGFDATDRGSNGNEQLNCKINEINSQTIT